MVREIIASNPLIFNIIVIVISLYLLAKAASYLVLGISNYAKKLGLSEYIIGTLVVAFAASAPEFLSSFSGILEGSSDVIFGTLFGSNFVAMAFILGLVAIIGKKVPMNEKVFHKTKWDILMLVSLKFILLVDGVLSRIDGLVLILAFVFYLYILWQREGQLGKIKKNVKVKTIYKDGIIFVFALITVLLAARFLVDSSLNVSAILGIHPFIVSVVLIGIGAQAPDLFLSINSARGGHQSVAFGDNLGSIIIQSLLFFGVFALIRPLYFPVQNMLVIAILSLGTMVLLFQFIKKKYLTRANGVVLLLMYVLFIVSQLWFFR